MFKGSIQILILGFLGRDGKWKGSNFLPFVLATQEDRCPTVTDQFLMSRMPGSVSSRCIVIIMSRAEFLLNR